LLDELVAERVEVEMPVAPRGANQRRQRGPLEAWQHGDEPVVAEGQFGVLGGGDVTARHGRAGGLSG
jgi:hypothetical protein